MFKKFDVKLKDIDYSKLKGKFFEAYGDTFKQYEVKDYEYLENLISDKIQFQIQPEYINICEITDIGAGPHIDVWKCSFNYYIESSNFTTLFWQPEPGYDGFHWPQIVNEQGDTQFNEVKAYDPSKLILVSSFVSGPHEAYLLDSKKIHSVISNDNDKKTRTMIRWTWKNYDFEEVNHSIKLL